MAEAGVITDYLTALAAQLPAPVVEELADGLDQTCQRYLDRGLTPAAAARAAVVEFGAPQVILAHFTRLSPARQAARRLLASGPVVGGCWAIALITGRAWSWPVPVAARLLLGIAPGRRYRPARHRRVRHEVPVHPPGRNRGMRRHHRARHHHARERSPRPPGRRLACDPGHGRERRPTRFHRPGPAPCHKGLILPGSKANPPHAQPSDYDMHQPGSSHHGPFGQFMFTGVGRVSGDHRGTGSGGGFCTGVRRPARNQGMALRR